MSPYTPPPPTPEERACLIGVKLPGSSLEEERENLRELGQLAATAGAQIVDSVLQQRTRIDGSTYIGKGKLAEIADILEKRKANLVIFDDDLSPAQARNIENELKVNIIDRTELILDIFSRRARTRQAKIQVEIAQLTYALPRLKRLWDHLSRQAGGIGTRGPGETQLEVDRRRVRERITRLEKDLVKIEKQVAERKKKRGSVFNVTIVGYTNAGKSTLLNNLSGSSVLESGKLFSTLDSTSRKVSAEGIDDFVLTDTIGFIRKLPAHLVSSFHATLMDVEDADLLLHLVDVSTPGYNDRISVVNGVLEEVLHVKKGDGKTTKKIKHPIPTILVMNKVDILDDESTLNRLGLNYPSAVALSAASGEGVGGLLEVVRYQMEKDMVDAEVRIPSSEGKVISMLERLSRVASREVEEEIMIFRVRIKKRDLGRIAAEGNVEVVLEGGQARGDGED